MTSIYEKYDLKQVINASGKMTALGVSKYVDAALDAQRLGGKSFFEMDQLYIQVGKYLAGLLGCEDTQIVSSASAGIAQSVAALIGKGSQFHVYNPYSPRIKAREIIVPKGHNVDFGAPIQTMVELGGGRVVEAGYANKCTPALVEDMISEETVAILYVKSHHSVQKSMLSVSQAAEVAKKHGLPLIIDAAAEQDLTKYLEEGADLVIYSGAKALEGTSSGIVIGKKEYVEWVRLQGKGIGRAMKIGKENILGLAAAIEYYLEHGSESGESMKARLAPFVQALNELPGVTASVVQDLAGREIYRAKVTFTPEVNLSGVAARDLLIAGQPAIYLRDHQVNQGVLEFDIRSVDEHEMTQIVDALRDIVTQHSN